MAKKPRESVDPAAPDEVLRNDKGVFSHRFDNAQLSSVHEGCRSHDVMGRATMASVSNSLSG